MIEKTDIEIMIQSALDEKVNEMMLDALNTGEVSKLSDDFVGQIIVTIPEELQAVLPEELKNMLQSGSIEMDGVVQSVIDTAWITERVVNAVALLIVLIFSRVAIMLAEFALGIASKLPLVGPLDKFLGFACGVGKGLVWSWGVLTVVSVLALTGTNTEWAGCIAESQFLTMLQENNLIVKLFVK